MKLRKFAILLLGVVLGFALAHESKFLWKTSTVSAETTAPSSVPIPVYAQDGSPLTGLHFVLARVPPANRNGWVEVKLNGAAAFKDNTYSCHVTYQQPGLVDTGIKKIDGSRFAILSAAAAGTVGVAEFLCIGQ